MVTGGWHITDSMSFHIFKQQWFVTRIPDAWATPANGKETPIYCAQLFFAAHRTNWRLRWLQVTLVTPGVFKVPNPFYTCKPEVWAGKLTLRMSVIKAAHVLNTNFITLLKSLKEIAHVPLYFRVLDLQSECCQARPARKYLEALHRVRQACRERF